MRGVFVDKDGTLVENVPYNVDPQCIVLAPGAALGIRRLKARGYCILVVSNQPGIGLGLFDEDALEGVAARLRELVPIDGFYYCPHRPDAGCACRKPSSAMLERAALQHGLHLSECWMVGDILDDVEAGRRAGCRTVLIDNGNETEWKMTPQRAPHFMAPDLAQAASVIIDTALVAA
jgi:D-glycero-D-manno-heptose 1,7-bisphosphate phosphatase